MVKLNEITPGFIIIVIINVLFSLLLAWLLTMFLKWNKERCHVNKLASFIPGPAPNPLIGNIMLIAKNPENMIATLSELIERYDREIFRIWKGPALEIYVTKPNEIEAILGNMKQFTKSREYDVLCSLMGDGLFTTRNAEKWKLNRKFVTPAFHFSILKGFLKIFHEEAIILADKIDQEVGTPRDVLTHLALCTLDTICRTAMGVSVNAQSGHGNEFVKNMKIVLSVWQERFSKVWYLIPFIFAMSSLKNKHDAAAKTTLSFTEEVIKKRKQEWEKNKDEYHKKLEDGGKLAFLDLMLGNGMTDRELRDETMTIIIGGQETTATALSFAILLISMHKNVQDKIHEELDIIFEKNTHSAPSLQDLSKLEYLERVIKETMRLFPPVPLIGRCLENDQKIGKYIVPQGTDIGILITSVHRDPGHWKEPHTFNPDRFLPENCRSRHPYSFMPFSAGLRNCIGHKFAMLEMKTVLATLLKRYNITASPEHKNLNDIELTMTTTLKSKKGFKVVFQYR